MVRGNDAANWIDLLGMFFGEDFPLPGVGGPSASEVPPGLGVDPSDGMGFYETAQNYYWEGGDRTVPFSSVDPGWGMSDLFTDDPCSVLGVYISQATSPINIEMTRQHDVFNWEEILNDSGVSGPGVVDIRISGGFWFEKTGAIENGEIYSWLYSVNLSAEDNLIDFDPKPFGTRKPAYKELISRGVDLAGGGHQFMVTFSGSRPVSESGSCCCKRDSPGFPTCSKHED
jgi:hypothetical protein